MDKKILILTGAISGFVLIIALFGVLFMSSENNKTEIESELSVQLYEFAEKAYFEGQRDALTGDIRVKNTAEGWIWTKSPWDNGQKPVYNPSVDFKD